jgi:CelD/BcsL family acetyltransferase involved in cellulose biosynthesis
MSGILRINASPQYERPIVGQAKSIVHARTPLHDEAHASAAPRPDAARGHSARHAGKIGLSVHTDLAAIEQDWRAFEQTADCTPFQTFDWLSTWQRHIGALNGVTPAIVIARRGGDIVMLLPLAVQQGFARRLTFLGQDLCDYNAPLLARDFGSAVGPDGFAALWRNIHATLQAMPALRHDTIALAKMPETIGAQPNPLLTLDVRLNPSGAYETVLGADWEQFYTAKRSSATRRRDRTKVKRLGEMGEVKFANPDASAELALTLDALVRQKGKSFARMGVPNIFERPGYAAFFQELATAPRMRSLVHLSRLDVGQTWAAVNLGLTFRDCYYHVLASYDDGEVSRFGPGAAHLRELLRFAIARGCTRFDFTIGDEPYKREWCEAERHLHDHSAAVTIRGWPSAAVSLGWRRIKRAIKKTDPLWKAAQRLRSAIAAMRAKRVDKDAETS